MAILVFTIIPFCPSVLWAQLIASRHGWRYCGALCGAWAAFGFLMTLIFYFPPPRVNSQGLSRRQIIGQIDFVGGFLSIAGMLLFMAGLQWGGYQVSSVNSYLPRKHEVPWKKHEKAIRTVQIPWSHWSRGLVYLSKRTTGKLWLYDQKMTDRYEPRRLCTTLFRVLHVETTFKGLFLR